MTVTVKAIIHPKEAESSQTTQYIAESCKTIIDKFTVTNTTASSVWLGVNLVDSGGAAGDSNLILGKTIAAGETYLCPEVVGHILEPDNFISTIAASANSLTIRASGREIT